MLKLVRSQYKNSNDLEKCKLDYKKVVAVDRKVEDTLKTLKYLVTLMLEVFWICSKEFDVCRESGKFSIKYPSVYLSVNSKNCQTIIEAYESIIFNNSFYYITNNSVGITYFFYPIFP